jgi:hypothetical protein
MNFSEIVQLLLVVASIFAAMRLGGTVTSPADSVGSYGAEGREKRPPRLNQAFFEELLSQNRRAFGLLWFTVAVGAMLGAYIIARASSGPRLDAKTLTALIGAASDIAIGGYAFKVYRVTSKRLDDYVVRVDGK